MALADTEMQLLLTLRQLTRERQRLAQYLGAHRVDGVLLVSVRGRRPAARTVGTVAIPAVLSGAAPT